MRTTYRPRCRNTGCRWLARCHRFSAWRRRAWHRDRCRGGRDLFHQRNIIFRTACRQKLVLPQWYCAGRMEQYVDLAGVDGQLRLVPRQTLPGRTARGRGNRAFHPRHAAPGNRYGIGEAFDGDVPSLSLRLALWGDGERCVFRSARLAGSGRYAARNLGRHCLQSSHPC